MGGNQLWHFGGGDGVGKVDWEKELVTGIVVTMRRLWSRATQGMGSCAICHTCATPRAYERIVREMGPQADTDGHGELGWWNYRAMDWIECP